MQEHTAASQAGSQALLENQALACSSRGTGGSGGGSRCRHRHPASPTGRLMALHPASPVAMQHLKLTCCLACSCGLSFLASHVAGQGADTCPPLKLVDCLIGVWGAQLGWDRGPEASGPALGHQIARRPLWLPGGVTQTVLSDRRAMQPSFALSSDPCNVLQPEATVAGSRRPIRTAPGSFLSNVGACVGRSGARRRDWRAVRHPRESPALAREAA